MMKILTIRTGIDEKFNVRSIDFTWTCKNMTKIEENDIHCVNCPNCDESIMMNLFVDSHFTKIKDDFEAVITVDEQMDPENDKFEENFEKNVTPREDVEKGNFDEVTEAASDELDEFIEEYLEDDEIIVKDSEYQGKHNEKIGNHKDTDLLFECETCKEKFNSKYSLRIHKNIHTDKFMCKICSTRFVKGERLKHHMTKHTAADQDLAKQLEKDEFDRKASKLLEMSTPVSNPPKVRSTLCPTCGKHFSSPASFYTHTQNAHQSRMYECNYCGKTLKSRRTLKHHMIRTHTDKTSVSQLHRCTFCPATYLLKRDLYMHLRAKHVPKEKKFVCEICKEAFIYKRELLDHVRVHQDGNLGRYKCEVCRKTFNPLRPTPSLVKLEIQELDSEFLLGLI